MYVGRKHVNRQRDRHNYYAHTNQAVNPRCSCTSWVNCTWYTFAYKRMYGGHLRRVSKCIDVPRDPWSGRRSKVLFHKPQSHSHLIDDRVVVGDSLIIHCPSSVEELQLAGLCHQLSYLGTDTNSANHSYVFRHHIHCVCLRGQHRYLIILIASAVSLEHQYTAQLMVHTYSIFCGIVLLIPPYHKECHLDPVEGPARVALELLYDCV